MSAGLDATYRPHIEGLLEPGAVAIGVTDRRLLVQPLNRRGEPQRRGLEALAEWFRAIDA